ncbi:MAG: hypothetical protein AMJ46_12075 [Latescibacteria bacterium DG_63]|nr:MAG: hypothetical protein AMJ46_12075 [Latescibacteria bacterium DG_63]
MTAAWAEDEKPAHLDQLQLRFDEAWEDEDYSKAIEIAREMNEIIEPMHVETLYNIARLYCILSASAQAR